MADIPQQVLQGLKQVVTETGEKALEEVEKIGTAVITGKELLGDIKPLTPEEMQKKKNEDEVRKQQDIWKLGRDVESEIKITRQKKTKEEDEKEKQFMEQLRQQREAEMAEREQLAQINGTSVNPAKRKKARGSALATGKKKTQQPDLSQMSSTSEFKGKID